MTMSTRSSCCWKNRNVSLIALVILVVGLSNNKNVSVVRAGFVQPIAPQTRDRNTLNGVRSFIQDRLSRKESQIEDVSICIIGGGVSGLTAAIMAAPLCPNDGDVETKKIVVLEASPTLGGRVQSDTTEDGYILDRGFAVFIEQYPLSKQLFDYDLLQLKKFLPGALVKLKDETTTTSLARVSDTLRQPGSILEALTSPVGSPLDKIRMVPLLYHVFTKSIGDLFQEEETSTMVCLKERWKFSNEMIETFFQPFLEGIYLAPLEQQSSRMFHFVLKMFSEGSAMLPAGGMGAVANQLVEKANKTGIVDIRLNSPVETIALEKNRKDNNDNGNDDTNSFVVQTTSSGSSSKKQIHAKSIILATDVQIAQRLMSTMDGFKTTLEPPQQQRSVGCVYYGFDTDMPVQEPILILSGIGEERGSPSFPINNVCFPSTVNKGYAPEGCNLCSVTILKPAMDAYAGKEKELDDAVRKQLAVWFPDYAADIQEKWEFKGVYNIPNAQPSQYQGPFPANVNGGRDCGTYGTTQLPHGFFVCGDHTATASLNGALESGVNAGEAAAKLIHCA